MIAGNKVTDFWNIIFPVPGESESAARRIEDAGWDGLFFPDTQCLSGDIYSAMCLAAKATTRLKLGTAVTNPVTRHPSVTASAIATVQVESDGRAVLGIGRGDSSLGYIGQNPAPARKLETYIHQVQRYLRGESVDLEGFESRNMWISESGQPKVPVDVAATGPRVIALAGRLAERVTFAVGADEDRLKASMEAACSARCGVGLDPNDLSFGAYINLACHNDVTKARSIIQGSTGAFAHFSGMSAASSKGTADAQIFKQVGANYDMANHGSNEAAHIKAMPDDFISRFGVTGSVEYCVERLGQLIELGLDRLVLLTGSLDGDPALTQASFERISNQVFPQLR